MLCYFTSLLICKNNWEGKILLVSFIIAAYNAGGKISYALDSLLRQDYDKKKIEVILVDGCSQDDTKKIMYEYKKNYENEFSRFLILDNPKRILPCAWNIALKNALGDVILRIDAHSEMNFDFISNAVELIEKGEKIVGGQRPSVIDEKGDLQKVLLLAEQSMFGSGIADYRKSKKDKYVSTLAHAAYSREVFETTGGYDERLARTEDNEIHYRMNCAGFKFYFSSKIKSFHHARSSFKAMVKQKYLNGFWIGLTMGVCPKCFSIYHLVPFLFVLSIIVSSVLAALGLPIFLILLFCLYFLGNISMSVLSLIGKEFTPYMLLLPGIFFVLHLSYGLGTLLGLLKMPFWRQRKTECSEIEIVRKALIENRLNNSEE